MNEVAMLNILQFTETEKTLKRKGSYYTHISAANITFGLNENCLLH